MAIGMTLRASKVLGAMVVDRQGERLGEVSDLLIEAPANICYALVNIGRPADGGGGERTVAVPWSVLQAEESEDRLVLDVSRRALGQLRDLGRP
jgi:sporulation protein YlmC with PRC-barrel domain